MSKICPLCGNVMREFNTIGGLHYGCMKCPYACNPKLYEDIPEPPIVREPGIKHMSHKERLVFVEKFMRGLI
jgi:hypothetical protein